MQIPDELEKSHLWDQRMEITNFVPIFQRNRDEHSNGIFQQNLVDDSSHGRDLPSNVRVSVEIVFFWRIRIQISLFVESVNSFPLRQIVLLERNI